MDVREVYEVRETVDRCLVLRIPVRVLHQKLRVYSAEYYPVQVVRVHRRNVHLIAIVRIVLTASECHQPNNHCRQ